MEFKRQTFFYYAPLDISQPSFRLCKLLPGAGDDDICCELTNELTEKSKDRYAALSYQWGQTTESRWIQLNTKKFHVQPNLFAALQAIRKPDEPLVLWVDAICINQLDVKERGHQVSQMGAIYANAELVYAWLGPEADDSDVAFDHLQHFDGHRLRSMTPRPGDLPKAAVQKLCHREYWHRMWIKHEIVLAKEIKVCCGTKSVPWETFSFWAGIACLVGMESNWEDLAIGAMTIYRKQGKEGNSKTLAALLNSYRMALCTDIRDRVFGLLSLASDCAGVEHKLVDYTLDRPTLFFALIAHFQPE